MIRAFITSFKLKNTYRVNSIIYSIKQIPVINRCLPNSLYKNRFLKILGNIISTLIEVFSIFLGKFLYIWLLIFCVSVMYKTNPVNTFLHIFTFLTLCGGLLNTYMFNPTKDKYYAMIIMNMDSKKYTLSNYYYSLLKVAIGLLPFTVMFGLMSKIPLWICLILPIFVIMMKMIVSTYCLYDFEKTKIARNENLPTKVLWLVIAALLGVAYGIPVLGITINQTIFIVIFILSIILGIYSFIKINNFAEYIQMYKQILTQENVYIVQNQTTTSAIKDSVSKQIELDKDFTSNKTGFSYFHELFVKRHSKILTKAVKKQSLVILGVFIVAILGLLINNELNNKINGLILMYLPYFVFVMYILNRGATLTQAMFMNCDHSMLTYRIYRTPKVILGLFKERLKTLIIINLFPAFIIGSGLPILLFLTGGTDNILNYAVLFFSIISMSVFFSLHYLVMYYLLQPYNINTEIKSGTYKLVQILTYFICYYMMGIKLSILSFGITMILFSVLYCLISLFLVYKYAPQTFKLRI